MVNYLEIMDMGAQYGLGTGIMDTDMQHGNGHAAWTWTCTVYMDMLNVQV
jgi:hypothetical protein